VKRSAAATEPSTDTASAAQGSDEDSLGSTPFVALLPAPRPPRAVPLPARAVPDVRGLPARQAARALHRAGFRVQLVLGVPGTTSPAAGVVAPAGTLVRLVAP
jgi:hypothetical protein